MSLIEQIQAQAMLLAGNLTDQQIRMLAALCYGAASTLEKRLRDGLTPGDCKADFIAAASLLALAAMNSATGEGSAEQISVGDFSVRTSKSTHDAASNCLRAQAELMIAPYLKDRFTFLGV